MKKELMKIRNRLLVYGLVTSIGIGVASCTSNKQNEDRRENVKIEKEYDICKVKEKRMDYGK